MAASDNGSSNKRVGVIGAGPSGLTAVKNLLGVGLNDIVCYEASDAIGGNWVFRDAPSHSSIYDTAHTISSKRLSSFEDFPMPEHYPQFPHHRQVLAYFEDYARHFDVPCRVRLSTRVAQAKRNAGGRWTLTLIRDGQSFEDVVDALIVCSGHHWDPIWPDLPGEFSGEILHSHDFKRAAPFRGRRVLVIGGGNSACDISVAVSRVAAFTAISMRQGYHILPRSFFGVPADIAFSKLKFLPKPVRQKVASLGVRLISGPPSQYGLPKPECRLLEMHPTLNSEFLKARRRDDIEIRPGIERIEQSTVHFVDGFSEDFDAIIAATGYRTSFPFLEEPFDAWTRNEPPPLYLRMMPADITNLYFIGLFQPMGSIWPLADHQARIAALQLVGRLRRPADLATRISREARTRHWRFQNSPRHALEVDYHEFRKALLREIANSRPEPDVGRVAAAL